MLSTAVNSLAKYLTVFNALICFSLLSRFLLKFQRKKSILKSATPTVFMQQCQSHYIVLENVMTLHHGNAYLCRYARQVISPKK